MLKLLGISLTLAVLLQTEGSVTGRVLSEDGRPLAGMEVALLRATSDSPEVSVRTDDRGEFRLFGIKPGRYYVRAGTPASIDRTRYANPWQGLAALEAQGKYSTVYYPQQTDVARASLVDVKERTTLTRVDFVLTRLKEYTIRGRVIDEPTGVRPEEDVQIFFNLVRQQPDETLMHTSREPYDPADGTFELNRLTPGDYWVIARKVGFGAPNAEGRLALVDVAEARAAIRVTDADVADVVLKLTAK
jgi:hypothetical protein